MKCVIANDLLSLYAEGLCSEETSAELEQHLKECEACTKQLEHYRADVGEKDEVPVQDKQLKPMKKVARKLKIKSALTAVLVLIIAVIVGAICVLSYGEITNYGVSFSLIADYFKLKSVSESLAKGDTQPLIDVLGFKSDHYYQAANRSRFKNPTQYKDMLKTQMDEACKELFSGRDITVRPVGMLLNGYDDDERYWNYQDPFSSCITFEFCEGENVILTLDFAKVRNGKFEVYDYDESDVTLTGNILPSDDILIELTMRTVVKNKFETQAFNMKNGSNGWQMMVDGFYGQDNTDYDTALKERIAEMYNGKIIPKDVMYALDRFDDEKGLWVYRVWVEYADIETGGSVIADYEFLYHNNHFYIDPDRTADVISGEDKLSDEEYEMITSIFAG